MSSLRPFLYLPLFFLLISVSFAKEPGADLPFISRYPESVMKYYDLKRFDEMAFLQCPASHLLHALKKCKTQYFRGKVTRIKYQYPKDRSPLEVEANYLDALKEGGYKIMAHLQTKAVRGFVRTKAGFDKGYPDLMDLGEGEHDHYYISAASPDGDVHIMVYVGAGYMGRPGCVAIGVVEKRRMQRGLVSAKKIADELKAQGHIPLYGIYFDFNKAVVRPESEPSIKEIAKFLQAHPAVRVYVVGHTDNRGGLKYNLRLSKKRAKAVVKELTGRYHIKPDRVAAYGVGPLCPVATNRTEGGRAKNRRVELVEQ